MTTTVVNNGNGNGKRRYDVWALMFAVVVQLCYLVWGGAKLSANQDMMLSNQTRMQQVLEDLSKGVNRNSARIDVIEDWRSRGNRVAGE